MEEAIRKASVLVEALPYIMSFRDKVVVVKLGGAFMTDRNMLNSTLMDIVFMESVGMKPVIVHGGGPEITSALKKRGVRARFVHGHRYTDENTLKVVREVLLKRTNPRIVRFINEKGGRAEALHSDILDFIRAKKFMPPAEDGPLDIGLVGEVAMVDTEPVLGLLVKDVVPVIAPLGRSADGQMLNINADLVASKLAGALEAEKFVLVSDTHGVLTDKDDPESLASTLHKREIAALMDKKAIDGGMRPKVQACLNALQMGVRKAHIVDGRIRHSLLLEIFTDKGIGTQIIHDRVAGKRG